MLLTDFYIITKQEGNDENQVNFQIKLNPEHAVYNGHFPAHPILPGVCTLQIIKECAEQVINSPLQYNHISICKFLSSVDPVLQNEISLSVSIANNHNDLLMLNATGIYMENPFIKLKALMKAV